MQQVTSDKKYTIVAPICSINEIEPVLEAGADEVYFGLMTDEWLTKYGDGDFITRRQTQYAHISALDELTEIISIVNNYKGQATLVLNSQYSESQLPYMYHILEKWEENGGHSVMLSDLELMVWLNEHKSRLKRQLSVMAGVFNANAITFFKQLNISRVVLPREMLIKEIKTYMTNADKCMEYEAITMFQKCEYIDSFCHFHHPCNEAHGCQMDFICQSQRIKHIVNNDMQTPFCAACSLQTLFDAGISHFKIAGRGYPSSMVVQAVKFTKEVMETSCINPVLLKEKYKQSFGYDCDSQKCYYA